MTSFRTERKQFSYSHKLDASAEKVFPLLCPTREYDWISNWECDLVYSKSGFAEEDCVFTTFFENVNQVWTVSRYAPEETAIEFIILIEDFAMLHYSVSVKDTGENRSEITWSKIFTSLNEQGNKHIRNNAKLKFIHLMKALNKKLNYFLVNGKMLEE